MDEATKNQPMHVEKIQHFFDDLTEDHGGVVAIMWDAEGNARGTFHGQADAIIGALAAVYEQVIEKEASSDESE